MAATIDNLLEDPQKLAVALRRAGIHDTARAGTNLAHIAGFRVPVDLLQSLLDQSLEHLPGLSDPDMALNNLERFMAAARCPLSLASLFERDPTAIPILLTIFSTSQYLTDLLIRDPSAYDALRLTAGQPVSREILADEIGAALDVIANDDQAGAMAVIRRFKHRETLRIAFGDIIGRQDLQTVTSQISYLAEVICDAALQFARRYLDSRHGQPVGRDGRPAAAAVIAMGKLGGNELNYSSDIDLVLFYDREGQTAGPRVIENLDYFNRLGRELVKLLNENTAQGIAYRVDLRLRPGGSRAPVACGFDQAIGYYDLQGRTWERQALVKARVIAGDRDQGKRLLKKLHRWVYAKRLSVAEINGIKALKRQIEQRARSAGDDETNIKTGHGGIRDIEFVIQFLQLLNGAESHQVRTGNTLDALSQLYQAGALNSQEQNLLDRGYRWLRRLEHRMQVMFDLQTHSLPENRDELFRLARRMDISGSTSDEVLSEFRHQLQQITTHNRTILDHLLHNAFGGQELDEAGREADLVLDVRLDEQTVEEILSQYGFANPLAAHRHLLLLASEQNRFLSSRRCRHFLAAIVKQLLTEISRTPEPDETLLNLVNVSESLGGKAALYELFSAHPPSMQLYVRLCAACDYLCSILTRNPGMIDELTDSLLLEHLPSREYLQDSLRELLAGAEDAEPIIHSFKDAHHLRVGARDILGRDHVARTHLALSDIAEVCLLEIAKLEHQALVQRLGQPVSPNGQTQQLVIVAMGKLGGREPNYHSDLDVVFLYPGDGSWKTQGGTESTTHQDFFSRLAANISKRISHAGPWGKLYEIDSRLRPTGKSGSLAVSLKEFTRYFRGGGAQLWERLALCKARPLVADLETTVTLKQQIDELITFDDWQPQHADEIASMRLRMQEGASKHNLKRGPGGTVDIEFAVEMLQLKYGRHNPDLLVPNTVQAAIALHRHALISTDNFEFFRKSWEMLRWLEARLRLMNTSARHDLPESPVQLARLAMLLDYDDSQELINEVDFLRRENRRRFSALIDAHGH
ncbi:MAG: bifunctional [glutamate--ammonia ligase]-adenylyl-L-tyrosine phosphorylase/[glutamate--ammonia-ligase] adenylyltransferase [Pirellulaceae bacterium]